jgi:RNA polymerase subunit RPABC4/transcription elongation factor Spt4
MLCPECKTELEDGKVSCPVCGWELTDEEKAKWLVIGTIQDPPFANLAREVLRSQGIPAVVISGSGFFGNIGLSFNPIFGGGKPGAFEIMVPRDYAEEARDTLDMTLGDKWQPEEN